jgi:hypothetical protein
MLPFPPSAFALLRPPRNLASQFESTTQTALPDHPTIADLPQAVWRNKRYVLEEPLSRKGSKGRKSWIKRHGLFLVNGSEAEPEALLHSIRASEHQSIRSEGDIPKNYSQRGSPRQHHRKGLATLRIFLNQPEDIIRCFSAFLTLHPGIVPGHPWAA